MEGTRMPVKVTQMQKSLRTSFAKRQQATVAEKAVKRVLTDLKQEFKDAEDVSAVPGQRCPIGSHTKSKFNNFWFY